MYVCVVVDKDTVLVSRPGMRGETRLGPINYDHERRGETPVTGLRTDLGQLSRIERGPILLAPVPTVN